MGAFTDIATHAGGILSAQTLGGSAGVQQFLAGVERKQAQKNQMEFKRESDIREQSFTLMRDKAQRAHDRAMQAERLSDKETTEDKAIRYDANGAYNYAISTPQRWEATSNAMAVSGITPKNNAEGGPFVLGQSREEAMPYFHKGAVQGWGSKQAERAGGDAEVISDWYAANTPGVPAPSGSNAPTQYLKDRGRLLTAQSKVSGITAKSESLSKELSALEGRINGTDPATWRADAVALAQRKNALGAELDALMHKDNPMSVFFGVGSNLNDSVNNLGTSLASIGRRIEVSQQSKGVNTVGAMDWADPLSFPGFNPGWGGNPGEDEQFKHLLDSDAFKAQDKDITNKINILIAGVSDADEGFLSDTLRDLRGRLNEGKAGADGQTYGLKHLVHRMRELNSNPTPTPAEEAELGEITRLISQVASEDFGMALRGVRIGKAKRQTLKTAMAWSKNLDRASGLGFALFSDAAAAQAALALHGEADEDGVMRLPEDRTEFLAAYVDSAIGQERLIDGVFSSVVGGEPLQNHEMFDQMQVRGNEALKNLGLDTGDRMDALKRGIATRLGDTATFEPTAPATQVHSYSPPPSLPSGADSWADGVDDARLLEHQENVVLEVLGSRVDPDAQALFNETQLARMRKGGPAVEQSAGWWLTIGKRFKGDEKRLRLPEEVPDPNSKEASFWDLNEVFKDLELYAGLASSPGRVADRAVKRPARGRNYGSSPATYNSWASGNAAPYILGNKSWAKEYKGQAADVDENTVNMMGRLDLMRGMDLSRMSSEMSTEQGHLLAGIQESLRAMTLPQALAAFGGDTPTGLPFSSFALDPTSPAATNVAARSPVDTRSLGEVYLDPEKEVDAIHRARRDLRSIESGSYVDLDQDSSKELFGFLTKQAIIDEEKELDDLEEDMELVKMVRASEIGVRSRDTLINVLGGGSIGSPEELADLLEANKSLISGKDEDLLKMERVPLDPIIKDVRNATSMRQALQHARRVFAHSQIAEASRMAVGLSATAPLPIRNEIVKNVRLGLGDMAVEVDALAQEIQRKYTVNEEFTIADVPIRLRHYIEGKAFDDVSARIGKGQGAADASQTLGTMLWLANKKSKN
jgi:hypothetical protein